MALELLCIRNVVLDIEFDYGLDVDIMLLFYDKSMKIDQQQILTFPPPQAHISNSPGSLFQLLLTLLRKQSACAP